MRILLLILAGLIAIDRAAADQIAYHDDTYYFGKVTDWGADGFYFDHECSGQLEFIAFSAEFQITLDDICGDNRTPSGIGGNAVDFMGHSCKNLRKIAEGGYLFWLMYTFPDKIGDFPALAKEVYINNSRFEGALLLVEETSDTVSEMFYNEGRVVEISPVYPNSDEFCRPESD